MKTISTLFGSVLALQTMMTVILMFGLVSLGWGQTAGPNNAGTGANVDKGDTNWSNPGNITTAGTPYATANIGTGTSDYLRGTSYGFSIPNGATIDGIEVTINRSGTQGFFLIQVVLMNTFTSLKAVLFRLHKTKQMIIDTLQTLVLPPMVVQMIYGE